MSFEKSGGDAGVPGGGNQRQLHPYAAAGSGVKPARVNPYATGATPTSSSSSSSSSSAQPGGAHAPIPMQSSGDKTAAINQQAGSMRVDNMTQRAQNYNMSVNISNTIYNITPQQAANMQ